MKETYNLWVIHDSNRTAHYIATVVATTFEEAKVRAIKGCGLDPEELVGWTIIRGNPKYYEEARHVTL